MIALVEKQSCTGCGACASQCPHSCITMQENEQGVVLPIIDASKCVECHACEKVCPVLAPPSPYEPQMAYAAWSNDAEERRTSASGGVAIELYKFALEHGYKAIGASQNKDFSVTHKVASTREELSPFKNSKYVFSDAYEAYPQIKNLLKIGERIIFIGLPCQVAALRKLFHDHQNLLLVEVVCHGTTPLSYLRQHIQMLERQAGKKAARMSFRDPDTYTYTYTFTLYTESGERFYAKRTKDGDTYQFGYHRSISYRENCYHCPFAKRQRVADITLSDYNGLGKMAPCDYSQQKVSCILVHSEKGKSFIKAVLESRRLHCDERPVDEPIAGDPRLHEPCRKSKARYDFERISIKSASDFETIMCEVIEKDIKRKKINNILTLSRKVLRKIMKMLRI